MTISHENSYLTIEEANEYFSGRLGSDIWTTLTETQKEQALITATKRIDTLPFIGYKCSPAQPLEFPRFFVDFSYALDFYTTAVVPKQIKNATAEEALTLVQYLDANGAEALNGAINTNYQSLKLGDASITYGNSTSSAANATANNSYGLLSDAAARFLNGLVRVGFNIVNPLYYEEH